METPADAPPAEDPYRCARCGAPHDAYQEYCLECGARLARAYPSATWTWRRETWTRESPVWFWATFLALLLVALIAGAIVLAATAGGGDDEPARTGRQGAGPSTSVVGVAPAITTSTLPPTVTITPTTGTTTIPTLTTRTTTGTTTTTTGTTDAVIAWPASKSGYTVILTSVPTSQGRSRAEATAREAIDDGLSEVGVLNSSDFSSLNAGYYVVFSGIHDTEAQARAALPRVRQAGYPIAYLREITP